VRITGSHLRQLYIIFNQHHRCLDKAATAIIDVVRGEGAAQGRAWPPYLVLGEDAEVNMKKKCAKVLGVLEEWVDVARGVSFDAPPQEGHSK
jgi:hypothetical protein